MQHIKLTILFHFKWNSHHRLVIVSSCLDTLCRIFCTVLLFILCCFIYMFWLIILLNFSCSSLPQLFYILLQIFIQVIHVINPHLFYFCQFNSFELMLYMFIEIDLNINALPKSVKYTNFLFSPPNGIQQDFQKKCSGLKSLLFRYSQENMTGIYLH